MPISRELLLTILAMDSYNRGYDRQITSKPLDKENDIGGALLGVTSEQVFSGADKNIGFYALWGSPAGQIGGGFRRYGGLRSAGAIG